ncbi:lipoprotein [Leyella stercorea]|uniref:lipoprotein n=1 Tax=Leyella stercorea TaxID=363265 RepID=UPI001F41DC42|nr:lipoprotein [Leyella stercorea]MCF2578211.1 lipoprotein [Leyella stercorea]
MKKILYFFVVLVLLTGCAKGQNKEELNKLRDSLDNMVLRGSLRNDTTMLERALKLSDFLLSIDTTNIGKRLYYRHRSIIFSSLGRMDEAMVNAEHAVLTLQANNPLRLIFMSEKYLREHNKDSAAYYIEKTIAVCDSSLNDEYNEDMAINKIKAIYLRDGEKKAKIYLSKLLRTHPSPLLKFFDEDWDEWVRMNNEELKLLNINILR